MIDGSGTSSVSDAWTRILGRDVYGASADARAALDARSDRDTEQSTGRNTESDEDLARRTVEDTITLSDGAQIVNLQRGDEIAQRIRTEQDPDAVRQLVKEGVEDVNRITRFFGEVIVTLKNAFAAR